jgi:hypothetical protein
MLTTQTPKLEARRNTHSTNARTSGKVMMEKFQSSTLVTYTVAFYSLVSYDLTIYRAGKAGRISETETHAEWMVLRFVQRRSFSYAYG